MHGGGARLRWASACRGAGRGSRVSVVPSVCGGGRPFVGVGGGSRVARTRLAASAARRICDDGTSKSPGGHRSRLRCRLVVRVVPVHARCRSSHLRRHHHVVSSVHATISAAPRRTAASGSRASCPQTAAMSCTPSCPMSASCTPVCIQSPWLSSAPATARAMSLTAGIVPTRARASAVCRVTAVSATSSSRPTNASAATGTSAKTARSRPARTRCDHEGDKASPKAVCNPLIASDTTRQSHAPPTTSSPDRSLLHA